MKNPTQFKLKSGKILSINNNALRCDKQGIPFTNIREDREYEIVRIIAVERRPDIPWPETDIDYHNMFTNTIKQHWPTRIEKENNFLTVFPEILARKELIMNSAEFFMIRIPCMITAGIDYKGGNSICLGGLLEAWETTNELRIKDPDGNFAFLFNLKELSPYTEHFIAWVPAKQSYFEGRMPMHWTGKVSKLLDINKRYPWRLHNDSIAFQKLMNAKPPH